MLHNANTCPTTKSGLTQPWQHSTGAKTAMGKAISSGNAFKGGLRSELRKLSKALREQRQAVEAL